MGSFYGKLRLLKLLHLFICRSNLVTKSGSKNYSNLITKSHVQLKASKKFVTKTTQSPPRRPSAL